MKPTRILLVGLFILSAGAALAACGDDSPPNIPHDITSEDPSYCLGCHRDGVNGAPQTPHPDRTGCTGCHKQGG